MEEKRYVYKRFSYLGKKQCEKDLQEKRRILTQEAITDIERTESEVQIDDVNVEFEEAGLDVEQQGGNFYFNCDNEPEVRFNREISQSEPELDTEQFDDDFYFPCGDETETLFDCVNAEVEECFFDNDDAQIDNEIYDGFARSPVKYHV